VDNLDDLWKTSELAIQLHSLYRLELDQVIESIIHDQDVVHLSKVFSGDPRCHQLNRILQQRAVFRNHVEYKKPDSYGLSFKDFESNHITTDSLRYDADPVNKRFSLRECKEDLRYVLRMLECVTGDRDRKEMYDFVNMTCHEWYLQRSDKFVKSPENISRLFCAIAFFGHACDIMGSGSIEAYFYCVPIPWKTYRMIVKKCQFELGAKLKELLLFDKDLNLAPRDSVVKLIEYVAKYREEVRCFPNYNVADETGFFYKKFESRQTILYDDTGAKYSNPRDCVGFFDTDNMTQVQTCVQWYTQGSDKFDGSLYNFNLLCHSICFFGHILDILGCGGVKEYFWNIPVSFVMYKAITRNCKFYPNQKEIGDSTI
jgi:hypothetical protein